MIVEGEVCLSYYGEDGERKIVFYAENGSIFGGVISLVLNRKVYGVSAMTLTKYLITNVLKELEKEKIIRKGSKTIMIPAGGKQKLKRYIKNIWV